MAKNQYEEKTKAKFNKSPKGNTYYYVYDTNKDKGKDDFEVFGNVTDAKIYAKKNASKNKDSIYIIKEEKIVGDYSTYNK